MVALVMMEGWTVFKEDLILLDCMLRGYDSACVHRGGLVLLQLLVLPQFKVFRGRFE